MKLLLLMRINTAILEALLALITRIAATCAAVLIVIF